MEQAPIDAEYTALHLAEEQACGRYLTARRELTDLAAKAASLGQLATEHPHRLDYQAAWRAAVLDQSRAMSRTGHAYTTWRHAQRRTDTAAPALVVFTAAAVREAA